MEDDVKYAVIDQVIKRRHIIDGDANGDDRRIVEAMKSFLRLCINEKQEVWQLSYNKLVNQMIQIEYDNKKTHTSIRVNGQAKREFFILNEQFEQEVDKAKEQVKGHQNLLAKIRERRLHRQRCAVLTTVIKTKPEREETGAKKLVLEEELKFLQGEKKCLVDKLDEQKKSMTDLVAAILRIQQSLDAEDPLDYRPVPMEIDDDDVDTQPVSTAVVANS